MVGTILNNPVPVKESYLVCRVTSQQNSKPKKFGCDAERAFFFLPANHDFFIEDTWIQLYEIFSFSTDDVLKDKFSGELEIKGKLQEMTIRQLMNCIKNIVDIPVEQKRMILKESN